LQRHGFNAGALHGDMDQHARTAMLESFRRGQLMLLVASDVAARGLDIPDVSYVFNFDVPTHAEDYVHRIGRTGRAGKSGTAVTLVAPADAKYVGAIEKLTGDTVSWTGKPASEARPERTEKPAHRRDEHRHARSEQKPHEAKPAEQTAQEVRPPEQKAPSPPPAQQHPRQDQRKHDRKPEERKGEKVVGLGDHVPQFLLRPVRLTSS
jgi:superfamily II DNA/RNA helicase